MQYYSGWLGASCQSSAQNVEAEITTKSTPYEIHITKLLFL